MELDKHVLILRHYKKYNYYLFRNFNNKKELYGHIKMRWSLISIPS